MKAYKYRVYPSETQKNLLARTFGCCRFVWNYLLAENEEYRSPAMNALGLRPSYTRSDLSRRLTELKRNPEYEWLYDVSSCALQQKVNDLAQGHGRAFKQGNKGFPKFKKKGNNNSFRIVGRITLKNGNLILPKDDTPLKIKWTRPLPRAISSYTVSQTPDGKYWISFNLVPGDNDRVLTNGTGSVGIDLGLKDLVIDSNGVKYDNPKWHKLAQERLAKAQRTLSKRKKGSNRRNKARMRVAKLHAKVRNQRKDYLHKLSRHLVNENQVIGMEDLLIKEMVKNSYITKSIMDAGWGLFKQMLIYKASESGHTQLVFMDRWLPSTQTCSACNHRQITKIGLSVREWSCSKCNVVHDRDINAAKNIEKIASIVAKEYPGVSIILHDKYKDLLNRLMPAAPVNAQSISM